ncbi:MAG: hypothetical protein Q8T09_14030, partial [Candidatus Melainabacteria bacterium]|nr:hypothetical protein [Candidatus Melainabacteria bacterium]
MNSQETINRRSLHNWFARAAWAAAVCVPDGLSRINGLVTHQQPFAVLVTATANSDREQSIAATVQTICAAHEAGWSCSPIKLSYRQGAEQLLQSDLALAIYKRDNDTAGDAVDMTEPLMAFVVLTLQSLDHKVAVMAGAKRTGSLDDKGVFSNSFRTDKMSTLLLRRYLGRLHGKDYALLELSVER